MTTRWPAAQRHRNSPHSWARPDGTQKIEDTGPLTTKKTMAAAAGSRAMQSTEGIEAAGGQPSVH
jgi:hypothetical protein